MTHKQAAFQLGFQKRAKELLIGGKGDDKPDSAFHPKQLAEGIKVEREHIANKKARKEIAKDHLMEDPFYYAKLKKMESGY